MRGDGLAHAPLAPCTRLLAPGTAALAPLPQPPPRVALPTVQTRTGSALLERAAELYLVGMETQVARP